MVIKGLKRFTSSLLPTTHFRERKRERREREREGERERARERDWAR